MKSCLFSFFCDIFLNNLMFIAPQDHCMRCSKHANAVKINRNLRSDLQMYFRNPKELLEQYVKNLNAVLDFQSSHRQHLQKAKQEQAGSLRESIVNLQIYQ